MLRTKSIFKPITTEDGTRISVMNRHTLTDGITPDLRMSGRFDEHLKILSPPAKLLGDYYKRGLTWEEYELKYNTHLKKEKVIEAIHELIKRSKNERITLLCVE